jgi:hypothetical protein
METNANAQVVIATLVHTNGKTVTLTGDMTKAKMLAAVKDTGNPIGGTSLGELIAGKKENVSGWSVQKPASNDSGKPEEKAGEQTTNQEAFRFPKGADMQAKQSTAPAAPNVVTLTPEQAALAGKVEAEMPTRDAVKPTLRGTDWSKVLPTEPQPVKKESMLHRLFVFLCTPGGVTKDQILKEFTWSAGGLSGILHWEPKAKGYFLKSEKRDGKLYYSLCYHTAFKGGAEPTPVQPEEILIRDGAAVDNGVRAKIREIMKQKGIPVKEAAPKAPKEPKAPKVEAAAAADASKAPKTPKSQMPASAGNITKRTSNKKAQQSAQ